MLEKLHWCWFIINSPASVGSSLEPPVGRPGGPRAPRSFQSPRGCGSARVTLPRDILYICVYSTYFITQVRRRAGAGRARAWVCGRRVGVGGRVLYGEPVFGRPTFSAFSCWPTGKCVPRGEGGGGRGRRVKAGCSGASFGVLFSLA